MNERTWWETYIAMPRSKLTDTTDRDTACPKCKKPMTYQGNQSVGAGSARKFKVPIYLCPACGCNGWYNEEISKILEIQS